MRLGRLHAFAISNYLTQPCRYRIEHINKWKKKQGAVVETGKQDLKEVALKVVNALTPGTDSDNSWKREVLEGRRKAKLRVEKAGPE